MTWENALDVLERARREQSVDLADGLIDDLVPYWEAMEEAFENIATDAEASEALAIALSDGIVRQALLESSHGRFFAALLARETRKGAASMAGDTVSSPSVSEDSLAGTAPDVADFIEHGLYEAFSVPDAYGTFDLRVLPKSCNVTGEYVNPEGDVTGYTLDSGKILLVTRDGTGGRGKVTDVRYAEATTNNIHLVMRQCEGRPFEWDSVESPVHDALRRDGALPSVPAEA